MTQHTAQLLSIQEACKSLGGIARSTLYELVNRGELEKVNIGRRGAITAASVSRYIERLVRLSAPDRPDAERRTVGERGGKPGSAGAET